jgi:hypothetical protein
MPVKRSPKPKAKASGLRPTPEAQPSAPEEGEDARAESSGGGDTQHTDPGSDNTPLDALGDLNSTGSHLTQETTGTETGEAEDVDAMDVDEGQPLPEMGIEDVVECQKEIPQHTLSSRQFVPFTEMVIDQHRLHGQTRDLDPKRVADYKDNMLLNAKPHPLEDMLVYQMPGMLPFYG